MNSQLFYDTLTALSPLDGRYAHLLSEVKNSFSEFALIKARVRIEVCWLRFLINHLPKTCDSFTEKLTENDWPIPRVLSRGAVELLTQLESCTLDDACSIKEIESETQHDVKAVELFIQRRIQTALAQGKASVAMARWKEKVHLGCTSEDINNLAYALLIKGFLQNSFRPHLVAIIKSLIDLAKQSKHTAMLSLTHGQPAVPTTFGKEIALFAYRLTQQVFNLDQVVIKAKFNGAVGNFNAHCFIYPDLCWPKLCKSFVESFQITYQPYSTQIESHDWLAVVHTEPLLELCHCMIRFHTICLDAVQDFWFYISRDYLRLKQKAEEVGSSTMPHKVNPIDFENAEGNLGLANALLDFFSKKLCISRMQRDLSDSTVLRNFSLAFGYSWVAIHSIQKGLSKIEIHNERLSSDLNNHWEVLAEPLQIYLRREGVPHAYELLKNMTRGTRSLDQKGYTSLTQDLSTYISEEALKLLKSLDPHAYVGNAALLTEEMIHFVETVL